jgi:hypothetical protein
MPRHAVDENVLVVANRRNTHADDGCVLACINFLASCREQESLVLDYDYEILQRYSNHCDHSGQPGVGDEFFRWAFTSVGTLHRVILHPHPTRGFEQFPDDPALATFDMNDRVYVAAAITGADGAVVNAVDSDYEQHVQALSTHVTVMELCRHLLQQRVANK